MSGQIRISKLYLAVLYSQKPRSTSPPVIFQTVSRRGLLGNRAFGISLTSFEFAVIVTTGATHARLPGEGGSSVQPAGNGQRTSSRQPGFRWSTCLKNRRQPGFLW